MGPRAPAEFLVFDRYLPRVAAAFGEALMLKGGLVLELRAPTDPNVKVVRVTK